ncbi:MAG TPA: PEP-CTERM sorting domain-containing protein, partial [Lacipirellulaceae bacterium]
VAGLAADPTIGGAGFAFSGAMALTNNGLISSQVSGRTITVKPDTFTNTGTLEATNGGSLAVPLGYTQTAGITRLSGGGTITALDPIVANKLNTITVGGGRLEGNGTIMANVANSGTIAVSPGSAAGTLPITGDLTLASTSALQFEIGGPHPGVDFDTLSEAGSTALNLAGTLSVARLNGYLPAAVDALVIISSNQPITGMFSNVVGGHVMATDGVTSLRVSVVGNHVVLNLLDGDYNHNGIVDAADYTMWRDTMGQTGPRLAADGNGNNQIDAGDYTVWKTNFGQVAGLGSGANASTIKSVPEPASILLLCMGLASVCARQRH